MIKEYVLLSSVIAILSDCEQNGDLNVVESRASDDFKVRIVSFTSRRH